jgi:xylulose-5-phosphate/fructose-6-phosphate phosphoketolase
MHELMAATLDKVVGEIGRIKSDARRDGFKERPRWPMIMLRTPKGWTCPKEIDGKRTEDYWRSHQVPMGEMHENPGHVRILEEWMKSYRPAELFDSSGRLRPELADLAPRGNQRMSANPHTNGGLLLRELRLPNFRDYAVDVTAPGAVMAESTRVMGRFLRDVMKLNMEARNFRLFPAPSAYSATTVKYLLFGFGTDLSSTSRAMIGNQKAGTLMTGNSNRMAAIQFCGTTLGELLSVYERSGTLKM